MGVLSINGIEVPIMRNAGPDNAPETIGTGLVRGQDASLRNNYNALKEHFSGKSPPMSQQDAMLIMALLQGNGDHWSWDVDGFSDKGGAWVGYAAATPALPTGVTLISATPTPKRGAKALQIDANAAHSIALLQSPLTDGWTVAVWYSLSLAAFDLWIFTGTGTVASGGAVTGAWKNGAVQSAVLPAWIAVDTAASTVTLKGVAGGLGTFDDLVVIPATISAAREADLNTFLTAQAWPMPYPVLLCSGSFHPVSLSMLGRVSKSANFMGVINGAYTAVGRTLEFELEEA